jgi:mannonate dehydratase
MKNNRRDFITKGASLAAAVSIGGITAGIARQPALQENESSLHVADLAKDAGMQASEAYFSGMNERKVHC